MLACPFCQVPETERITVDGRTFVIFRCLFTPEIDPRLDDDALRAQFQREYGEAGSAYFRRMCDRLHLYVTKGKGAEALGAPPASSPGPD